MGGSERRRAGAVALACAALAGIGLLSERPRPAGGQSNARPAVWGAEAANGSPVFQLPDEGTEPASWQRRELLRESEAPVDETPRLERPRGIPPPWREHAIPELRQRPGRKPKKLPA